MMLYKLYFLLTVRTQRIFTKVTQRKYAIVFSLRSLRYDFAYSSVNKTSEYSQIKILV